MTRNSNISIIGVGRLGGALAIALARTNFRVENLVARNFEVAEKVANLIESQPKLLSENEFSEITSDIILITTQDFEISKVSRELAGKLESKPIVFHTTPRKLSARLPPPSRAFPTIRFRSKKDCTALPTLFPIRRKNFSPGKKI